MAPTKRSHWVPSAPGSSSARTRRWCTARMESAPAATDTTVRTSARKVGATSGRTAPVTQRPGKDGEEGNGWPAVADRECHTDHQCHRGYCWHGTCSCKDGFVKERSFSGSWSCVHRTSSFGFGILAVIPVTVVVLCLFACCVQVALRKQQQMPSNAAAVQPEGAQDDGNAGTSAAGVSNIYRQRRYFPHYVESPKPHVTNEALAAPTASCATEMEPVEAKETAPDIGEAGSSANANHSLQA
ncbi:uncharacterized protein LOC142588541 isoform X2 [Dermacentor variabilis]|uniref:uncharacterized protein LOC142588541 isoform X2 n=1 Tax=Dermacentor variabilis TaxID=34621 RepID=UPI003F5C2D1F